MNEETGHHLATETQRTNRQLALLHAATVVSRNITSILDLDELLSSTVDLICQEYGFYYAGIFLVEMGEDGRSWAILRAGYGDAGRQMIANNHRLEVGGNSMIGAATSLGQARISLAVDREKVWFPNPILPKTRSEMALPLIAQDKVIGALTVQSTEEAAFSEEDISSLQIMADQLAVAINNAYLLQDLAEANQRLVRTKAFESIANATGEVIHWVGNKAAPMPASVERLREDIGRFLYLAGQQLARQDSLSEADPVAGHLIASSRLLAQRFPELEQDVERLKKLPATKLQRLLSIESILEDLEIIEDNATVILDIKEDLIGPARRQKRQKSDIIDIIQKTIKSFGQPQGTISWSVDSFIPPVQTDPDQIERVFTNLIKNALEAMEEQPFPRVFIAVRREDAQFVRVDVADIGSGIPKEELTKIWITFHTTKAGKGGTGLGLPACLQIMENMGGKIDVSSEVGIGSTFTLHVPVHPEHVADQGPIEL